MSFDQVIEKIKARLAQVDPNNRKVVAIFQYHLKTASGIRDLVIDLKDLKVYEGVSDAADGILHMDEETFLQLAAKAVSFADVVADVKVKIEGNVELVHKVFAAYNSK